MGQYFKAVNLDKRELVCPWCLGGGAKLWEWAANPTGSIFTLLLRRSSSGGGGDYYGYPPLTAKADESNPNALAKALRMATAFEGKPIEPPAETIVGRWAGDRVCLIGDYDESRLWEELDTFRNVSEELAQAWNSFIGIPSMMLEYRSDCDCH